MIQTRILDAVRRLWLIAYLVGTGIPTVALVVTLIVLDGGVPRFSTMAILGAAMFATLVVHELGHAVAAAAVGFGMRAINLGFVRICRDAEAWRFGPGNLEARFSVILRAPHTDLGWRSLLVDASGNLANILIGIGAGSLLWLGDPRAGPLATSLLDLAALGVWFGIAGFVPVVQFGEANDGLKLLRLLIRSPAELAGHIEDDGGDLIDTGRPLSQSLCSTRAILEVVAQLPRIRYAHFVAFVRAADDGDDVAAKALVERFVAEPVPTEIRDLLLSHAAAWLALREGDVSRARGILARRKDPHAQGWIYEAAVGDGPEQIEARARALEHWEKFPKQRLGDMYWLIAALERPARRL